MAYKIRSDKLCNALKKCLEKEQENKYWQMYLALYPHMIIPNAFSKNPVLKMVSFEDFMKNNNSKNNKKTVDADEIKNKFSKLRNVARVVIK